MITNIYWLVIGLALRGAVLAPCRIRRHPYAMDGYRTSTGAWRGGAIFATPTLRYR